MYICQITFGRSADTISKLLLGESNILDNLKIQL